MEPVKVTVGIRKSRNRFGTEPIFRGPVGVIFPPSEGPCSGGETICGADGAGLKSLVVISVPAWIIHENNPGSTKIARSSTCSIRFFGCTLLNTFVAQEDSGKKPFISFRAIFGDCSENPG
jgi:hypothetical protein